MVTHSSEPENAAVFEYVRIPLQEQILADLVRMQQETWCFAIWHLGYLLRLCVTIPQSEQREQECYQFENVEDFRNVVNTRYRLVPYLYSEYMKAVLNDDMYFKPLGFVYPDDKMAIRVEDQLILGNEIMIAPVYEQNARGRYVYSSGRNEVCEISDRRKYF